MEEDRVVIRNEIEMTQSFLEARVMGILKMPPARYLHLPALYDRNDVYLNKTNKSLWIKRIIDNHGVNKQALISYVGSLGFPEDDSTFKLPSNERMWKIFGSLKEKSQKFEVDKIRVDNCRFDLDELFYTNMIVNRNRLRLMSQDSESPSSRDDQLAFFTSEVRKFTKSSTQ